MARVPQMIEDPVPTKTIRAWGDDGIDITQAFTDYLVIRDTLIEVHDGGRSGIMMPNTRPDLGRYPEHLNPEFSGLIIKAMPRDNTTKWGMRRYGLIDSTTMNCWITNIGKEHPIYDELWGGHHLYQNLRLENSGAQGLQIRLTEQPASLSPHWTDERVITLVDVVISECGQKRGAGRAGFGLSIKSQGPNTDVQISDLFVQTIKQRAVKVKADGTPIADSFGAICIETVRSLRIEGHSYVNMLNPDRHAIQLFDSAVKSEVGGGPQESIYIDGLHLENQVVVLREVPGLQVDILNPKGSGAIIVQRFINGVWKKDETIPWSKGYTFRG